MISIVVPAYNAANTIDRAIKSVLQQTYSDWELIIVDDGSIDNTISILKRYKDKRIHLIEQNHLGPGAARNRGIDEARGEYVAFFDSDDVIRSDYLQILYDLSESNNADISMCSYRKVPFDRIDYEIHNGILLAKNYDLKSECLSAEECYKCMFYKDRIMPYPWLKLFRRTAIGDVRFPEDILLGEDLEFNIEVLKNVNGKIVYSPIELYFYIQNDESIIHSVDISVASSFWRLLYGYFNSSPQNCKKAIINRLFIAAYDFLSQPTGQLNDSSFYSECMNFVKAHKSIVLKDGIATKKVRLLALGTFFSTRLVVFICRVVRIIPNKKAV